MISTRLRVKELLRERRWTTKVLAEKGSYEKVMKRFRQIEFFKHIKGKSRKR